MTSLQPNQLTAASCPTRVSPPELPCYGAVCGQCVSVNGAEDRLQIVLISGLQMRAGFTRLSISSLHLDNQKAPLSPHNMTALPREEPGTLNASTAAAVSPGPCSEPMSQLRCCTGLCGTLSPPWKEEKEEASTVERQALKVLAAGAARCVSWRAPSQRRNTLAWESPGAGRAWPWPLPSSAAKPAAALTRGGAAGAEDSGVTALSLLLHPSASARGSQQSWEGTAICKDTTGSCPAPRPPLRAEGSAQAVS